MWYDNDRCVHLCHKDAMGEHGKYPLYRSIQAQSIVQCLQYVAWTYHIIFKAYKMVASKGIQCIESICEKIRCAESICKKIWRAESFSLEKPRRFGAPNLFVNRFDWSDPLAHGHPESIKYEMLSSGNIS